MDKNKYYYCFRHNPEIQSTTSFDRIHHWFKLHPIDEERFYKGECIYISNFRQYCCLTEEGLKECLVIVYKKGIIKYLDLIKQNLHIIENLKNTYSSKILKASKLKEGRFLESKIKDYISLLLHSARKLEEISENPDEIIIELEKDFPNLNIYNLYNKYFN